MGSALRLRVNALVAAKSIDTPTTIAAEGGEISTNLAYSLS